MNKIKLYEIAEVSAGQGAPQGDNEYSNKGTPFVKAGNLLDLVNGLSIDSIQKVTEDTVNKYRLKKFQKGTVVFAKSGMSCLKGYVYTLPIDAYVVNHLACVIPYENTSEYLKYYFMYHKPSELVKDPSYPSIRLSDISDIELRLPKKNEMVSVVKTLDIISKIINQKTQQLSEYDQLIKSRFVEMFEAFDKTDLSNLAEIIMGQSPDSTYYNENGVGLPFFQGKADFGTKYTQVSYWTTKPSKTAKKGNVLMSVRAPVGPVNISSVDCCIGRGLCSINAIPNKTNNEFLYNALIAIQDQISAMGTGSTFKAINKSDVYSIQLPLAPISLQNEFAKFVEKVDKLKFEVQKSLDQTQMLFDSLMQEYFG